MALWLRRLQQVSFKSTPGAFFFKKKRRLNVPGSAHREPPKSLCVFPETVQTAGASPWERQGPAARGHPAVHEPLPPGNVFFSLIAETLHAGRLGLKLKLLQSLTLISTTRPSLSTPSPAPASVLFAALCMCLLSLVLCVACARPPSLCPWCFPVYTRLL